MSLKKIFILFKIINQYKVDIFKFYILFFCRLNWHCICYKTTLGTTDINQALQPTMICPLIARSIFRIIGCKIG